MISFVYVFSCEKFIKVGVSKKPIKRMESLMAGNPFQLKIERLFSFFYDACAFHAEKKCHEALSLNGLHHRGEWFVNDNENKSINIIDEILSEKKIAFLEERYAEFDLVRSASLSIRRRGRGRIFIKKSSIREILLNHGMPIAASCFSEDFNMLSKFVIVENGSYKKAIKIIKDAANAQ